MLWIALALERIPSPALTRSIGAAAFLQIISVISVLTGHCGMIDPGSPAQPYEHLARFLAAQPGPVFVQDTYGDLPWISPKAPHFVIAYNDGVDALAGVHFQEGGWPGLAGARLLCDPW